MNTLIMNLQLVILLVFTANYLLGYMTETLGILTAMLSITLFAINLILETPESDNYEQPNPCNL
jgi:hypothetical protein